jgi:hypothetical protein
MSKKHFAYERDAEAWWKDQFTSSAMDPICAEEIDGDEEDDRVVVIGGADGYIRFIDAEADDDDGQIIASSVYIGPLRPSSVHDRLSVTHVRAVLAGSQDGCTISAFSSNDPDQLGSAKATATLEAGRNNGRNLRCSGQAIWLLLSNGTLDSRWALESMGAVVFEGGPARR